MSKVCVTSEKERSGLESAAEAMALTMAVPDVVGVKEEEEEEEEVEEEEAKRDTDVWDGKEEHVISILLRFPMLFPD